MFTGIVQGQAVLNDKKGDDKHSSLRFTFPNGALANIQTGASIAINGTCLTVTEFDIENSTACFDAISETLKLTNLGLLKPGDSVNYERAAKVGDEIGGHMMSGHIFCSVELMDIQKSPENCSLFFKLNKDIAPYILAKGFVGLNGCSLTIGEVTEQYFNVHLIPETLKLTTFDTLKLGDKVNLELDSQTQAIVDTVEKVLARKDKV